MAPAWAWPPPASSERLDCPRVATGRPSNGDVGDRLDVVVGVGIEVLPGLPLIPAALNHVIQVRNHAGGEEGLAVVVEIDAPGIAGAVGEDFEFVPRRVIAPDAGVDAARDRRRGVPGLPTVECVNTPWQP